MWKCELRWSLYECNMLRVEQLAGFDLAYAFPAVQSEDDVVGGKMRKEQGGLTRSCFHGVLDRPDVLRVPRDCPQSVRAERPGPMSIRRQLCDFIDEGGDVVIHFMSFFFIAGFSPAGAFAGRRRVQG